MLSRTCKFWRFKGLFVKIKSIIELLFSCFSLTFFEWTRFFKLKKKKKKKKSSSLSLSELEFSLSILKSANYQVFIFAQSFTNYFIDFFKECFNTSCWWRPIYTKTDPLYLWNCKLRANAFTTIRFILHMKPCLTNSISLSLYLCLSRLTVNAYLLLIQLSFTTKYSRGKNFNL